MSDRYNIKCGHNTYNPEINNIIINKIIDLRIVIKLAQEAMCLMVKVLNLSILLVTYLLMVIYMNWMDLSHTL